MKCMALNQQGMHALIRGGIVKSLLTVVVVMQLVACGGGSAVGRSVATGSGSGTVSSSGMTSGTNTSTSSSSGQSSESATVSSSGMTSGTNTSTSSSSGQSSESATVSSSGMTSGTSTSTSSSSDQSSESATGSLSLNWVAPVARADGTPLSLADIDGFNIYYGNKAGSYPYSVKVTDGTAQRITLNNLAIGTYYIVMTTYDVDGRESGYSAMVKKSAS